MEKGKRIVPEFYIPKSMLIGKFTLAVENSARLGGRSTNGESFSFLSQVFPVDGNKFVSYKFISRINNGKREDLNYFYINTLDATFKFFPDTKSGVSEIKRMVFPLADGAFKSNVISSKDLSNQQITTLLEYMSDPGKIELLDSITDLNEVEKANLRVI